MNKNLAKEFVDVFQSFQKKHRNKLKLSIKGEEAILILINESDKDTVTPSCISEKLDISSARVAAALNKLEDKNLLTRKIDTIDRRKIIIELSNEGKDLANKIKFGHLSRFNKLLDELGEQDSLELLRIIKKINEILIEGV